MKAQALYRKQCRRNAVRKAKGRASQGRRPGGTAEAGGKSGIRDGNHEMG